MHRIRQLMISCILPFRDLAHGSHNPKVMQISVLASGTVLLNRQIATIPEVKRALSRAKARRQNIWFYREGGKGDPAAAAIELFKFIVENQLPVSISSRADFADYLDAEGRSQPRKL